MHNINKKGENMDKNKCFDCNNIFISNTEEEKNNLIIKAYCENEEGYKTNFDGCNSFCNNVDNDITNLYKDFKQYDTILGKRVDMCDIIRYNLENIQRINILKKLGLKLRKIDLERMAERLIDVWFGARGYGAHCQYGAIGYNIIDGKLEYYCFEEYIGMNGGKVKQGVLRKEVVELFRYDANMFKEMCHNCRRDCANHEEIVDKYQIRECRIWQLDYDLHPIFKEIGNPYESTQHEEEIIEEILRLKQKKTELLEKVLR